ncbi:unnamed protein product [Thelazia callipaeda]|uniref:Uncharacterized protein n=1 Tax=Thelazia callipaeda TaxID=103827 RepID=A0A0N5CSX9_THECL|nr:unnamed protein product [Thelazia callipaeda]
MSLCYRLPEQEDTGFRQNLQYFTTLKSTEFIFPDEREMRLSNEEATEGLIIVVLKMNLTYSLGQVT